MTGVRCPNCGKINPADLEICQFCDFRLTPAPASSKVGSGQLKLDNDSNQNESSEFENQILKSGDFVPIGEFPPENNNENLASIESSRLESLQKDKDASGNAAGVSTSSNQGLSPESITASSADSADLPEWLSGLEKVASDNEEQVPDWLVSLSPQDPDSSYEKPASLMEPAPQPKGAQPPGSSDHDWLPGSITGQEFAKPETVPPEDLTENENVPNWLEPQADGLGVQGSPDQVVEPKDQIQPGMPGLNSAPQDISLKTIQDSTLGDDSPDWLNQLKEKTFDPDLNKIGERDLSDENEVPDWLSNFRSMPGTPEAATGESVPEWLSDLEAKKSPESVAPASIFRSEAPVSSPPRNATPSWLSDLQADVNAAEELEARKEQFIAAPQPQAKEKGTGPLPDWLAGIKATSSISDRTPALISNDESPSTTAKEDTAFSMDIPDWLSKLKPEQVGEKTPEGVPEPTAPENLEVSELPSWIQAMRPVESVVTGPGVTSQDVPQVPELSGPLAGLRGVLPVGPGLGLLRKPPVYSTKLQITESQEKYAAAFEALISSETLPLITSRTRLSSDRLWRWAITILLILAIGLPLVTGFPVTPVSTLNPPQTADAFNIIDNLSANEAVLVVFDYDPAFAGELERAAAPLLDHLVLKGSSLVLISTNPTGPALADRLVEETSASSLVDGQQVVNLGYLAGGSSGVYYFAIFPAIAAPFTQNGQEAWQLPPLQGVKKISDFAALIILSDNADGGRMWIEQTSSSIGLTPIIMAISTQAQPMLLPYYDSGQIKGLVTGLAGGEAYGQNFLRPDTQAGLSQPYWNSFSTGTLVAEILIFIGALVGLIAGLLDRRKKSGVGV
jgi:hypothetical protein